MKSARLFRSFFLAVFVLGLLQCDMPKQEAVAASMPKPKPKPETPSLVPPPPVRIAHPPQMPGSPRISYWQDATFDGGLVLLNEILENATPGEFIAILIWLGLINEIGYDIYAIRVKFSNPDYQKIVVSPKQFRVNAGSGRQSYPLELFLVPRNGDIEHWETVIMPGGSSVELYGYYAAPKNFVGSTLSVN